MPSEHSPGHTWAARRDEFDREGFYDATILGSGVLVMAMAAIGRYWDIEGPCERNQRQATHYSDWAARFSTSGLVILPTVDTTCVIRVYESTISISSQTSHSTRMDVGAGTRTSRSFTSTSANTSSGAVRTARLSSGFRSVVRISPGSPAAPGRS